MKKLFKLLFTPNSWVIIMGNYSFKLYQPQKCGVEHVVYQELNSEITQSIKYIQMNPEELPNVNINIDRGGKDSPINSIYLTSAKLKGNTLKNIFVMTLSHSHNLQIQIKQSFLTETTLTLNMKMDLPSLIYVGTIVDSTLPYTIVATEVKTGFFKKKRMFIPLKSENFENAKKEYKSQERLELIDQLNADENIKSRLRELPNKCFYTAEIKSIKGKIDSFSTKIEPNYPTNEPDTTFFINSELFKHNKEGFMHLIPIKNKTAITLVSTPNAISFPLNIFPKFDEELVKIRETEGIEITLEHALVGRRILLDLFTPYKFLLRDKLSLIERVAKFVQNFNYDGECKSNFVPKGGILDFLNCITRPRKGRVIKVDDSIRPLSKDEYIGSACGLILNSTKS